MIEPPANFVAGASALGRVVGASFPFSPEECGEAALLLAWDHIRSRERFEGRDLVKQVRLMLTVAAQMHLQPVETARELVSTWERMLAGGDVGHLGAEAAVCIQPMDDDEAEAIEIYGAPLSYFTRDQLRRVVAVLTGLARIRR